MILPNEPRVLAATYNPVSNTKMISFLVDFPTVLLAELRTHRILTQGSLYEHVELNDFNLSANSARAIPAEKYLEKVLNHPFVPMWTKQQKGMTGGELDSDSKQTADNLWLSNLQDPFYDNDTAWTYEKLIELKIHKQNANRLLAPYAWTTCIISGTEWDNFFELRCPKYKLIINGKEYVGKSKKEIEKLTGETFNPDDLEKFNFSTAQPEFQVIAEKLYDLYQEQEWIYRMYHIPFRDEIVELYGDEIEERWRMKNGFTVGQSSEFYHFGKYANTMEFDEFYDEVMKISASMCAKLSYNTHEKQETLDKHLERVDRLIKEKHWEPFSHQAIAMNEKEYENMFIQQKCKGNYGFTYKKIKGVCYNLRGFISQRYILENL